MSTFVNVVVNEPSVCFKAFTSLCFHFLALLQRQSAANFALESHYKEIADIRSMTNELLYKFRVCRSGWIPHFKQTRNLCEIGQNKQLPMFFRSDFRKMPSYAEKPKIRPGKQKKRRGAKTNHFDSRRHRARALKRKAPDCFDTNPL